jgi:putative transposase
MARLGRYFVEGQALHVIQRGNDRQAIFYAEGDYVLYRDWLAELAGKFGAQIHAWVLMTNHVHLLLTPGSEMCLPRLMQSHGRRYVGHINRVYRRTGTLWEGRYRAAPVESGAHLLTCYRYIELNPVRAGMVAAAGDYPWSSHRANAQGAADPLVTPHALYQSLGESEGARRAAYRETFPQALEPGTLEMLRQATNGGWAIGSDRFRAQIEALTARRAAPRPKGRRSGSELGSDTTRGV